MGIFLENRNSERAALGFFFGNSPKLLLKVCYYCWRLYSLLSNCIVLFLIYQTQRLIEIAQLLFLQGSRSSSSSQSCRLSVCCHEYASTGCFGRQSALQMASQVKVDFKHREDHVHAKHWKPTSRLRSMGETLGADTEEHDGPSVNAMIITRSEIYPEECAG